MATHTKETLLAIVEKIRYDTTSIQANVTELARAIAALPIPEPKAGEYRCTYDGLTFPSEQRLNEHRANVHDDYVKGSPISGVAFPHARAAEAVSSPADLDVSKLTCRDEQADA